MPFTFYNKQQFPCGFAMTGGLTGEKLVVELSNFYTIEDGNDFISRIESCSEIVQPALDSAKIMPSGVDHLLAILYPDQKVTVYCNELKQTGRAQLRDVSGKGIKSGQGLTVNHITEFLEMELSDADSNPIDIPLNCGIIYIFSIHWRKGLYFDFSPFSDKKYRLPTNLKRLFGHYHTVVTFQELYSATDTQWAKVIEWGWFPFAGMPIEDRITLFALAKEGRYLQPHFEEYCRTFAKDLGNRIANYEKKEYFLEQIEFIKQAYKYYQEKAWHASMAILGPRIEGIMRFALERDKPSPNKVYVSEALQNIIKKREEHSALFPEKFKDYLNKYYFNGFDVNAGKLDLSRHSHAHGVSRFEDYTEINATLQFLILDQLFFFLA